MGGKEARRSKNKFLVKTFERLHDQMMKKIERKKKHL